MSNPNKLVTQVSNGDGKFIGAKLSSQVSMTKKEVEGGKVTLTKTKDGKLVLPDDEYKRYKNNKDKSRSKSKRRDEDAIMTQDDEDYIKSGHNSYIRDPNAKYYFDVDEYFRNDHENNLIIHLNIQENHYYITREQLLALPESLLLCLFPNGVFSDRNGEVIQTLTENDEVYIYNFSNKSFEYIMDTYSQAAYDLTHNSIQKLYDTYGDPKYKINDSGSSGSGNSSSGGFFSHFGSHSQSNSSSSKQTEINLLNSNPAIIVLREDLDYYVVETNIKINPNNHEIWDVFKRSCKLTVGSYLQQDNDIYNGLYCSNKVENSGNASKLGSAEQHLMDMLISSGLKSSSTWGQRTQDPDKTVISSLTLIRLHNTSTQEYRDKVSKNYNNFLEQQSVEKKTLTKSLSTQNMLTPTTSRKSRWSKLSAVKSGSKSRSRTPGGGEDSINGGLIGNKCLYDFEPKPELNSKLLLFWKKPARKCWWGQVEIRVPIELPFHVDLEKDPTDGSLNVIKVLSGGYSKLEIPVRVHIRHVWTLEASIVGA
ncbi:hypothetical protein HANVADRAFT_52958 [Hanseniaspora valbyensis NRRL Y-1626]|uniref:Uncharacterized protein n=1 Tax=Hanseniaspora valbyensis NRRL Y-1626 TaxID=766949 RepID=A0A1B7TD53_9ASCO|nr:hypothetical protein HANVADRAFT_52958 [Hanseniaspora valbyensis NRRL Y-1626]